MTPSFFFPGRLVPRRTAGGQDGQRAGMYNLPQHKRRHVEGTPQENCHHPSVSDGMSQFTPFLSVRETAQAHQTTTTCWKYICKSAATTCNRWWADNLSRPPPKSDIRSLRHHLSNAIAMPCRAAKPRPPTLSLLPNERTPKRPFRIDMAEGGKFKTRIGTSTCSLSFRPLPGCQIA